MTKTIRLSDEAFDALRRHTLAGESFSDTVLRLTCRRGELSEIINPHPELSGKTGFSRAARETRRRLDARVGTDYGR